MHVQPRADCSRTSLRPRMRQMMCCLHTRSNVRAIYSCASSCSYRVRAMLVLCSRTRTPTRARAHIYIYICTHAQCGTCRIRAVIALFSVVLYTRAVLCSHTVDVLVPDVFVLIIIILYICVLGWVVTMMIMQILWKSVPRATRARRLYGPNTHNHADKSATLAEQRKERARGWCVAGIARQHPECAGGEGREPGSRGGASRRVRHQGH